MAKVTKPVKDVGKEVINGVGNVAKETIGTGLNIGKDVVSGVGTSDYKLFDYPTESHGSGTAPHIHVEFTRLLPYDNRAYVSQYVHPDTLQPGSRFKYNLNYYDKDMNLVEPRRYAQNFGRLERKECR